jgi:hypothetical protein
MLSVQYSMGGEDALAAQNETSEYLLCDVHLSVRYDFKCINLNVECLTMLTALVRHIVL